MFIMIVSSIQDLSEQEKFEKIYYKYRNLLFSFALSIVSNEQDAEDVLQNALIKISQNMNCIGNIDSKQTVSFLIVITKNTAYDFIRKKKRLNETPLDDVDIKQDSDLIIEKTVAKLEYEKIVGAIKRIPTPYYEVLYFHYVYDYSAQRIAKITDRKLPTVKMQLVRGKKLLCKELEEVLYD